MLNSRHSKIELADHAESDRLVFNCIAIIKILEL